MKSEGSDAYVDVQKNSLGERKVAADGEYACWNWTLDCEGFC